MSERQFGVEIELGLKERFLPGISFVSPITKASFPNSWYANRAFIYEKFEKAGLKNLCFNYELERTAAWNIKADSSVAVAGCYNYEVNSPILKGADGIKELKTAVKILKDNGGTTNTTCGIHVHVDVRDLKPLEVGAVFVRYQTFQEKINKVLTEDRVTGIGREIAKPYNVLLDRRDWDFEREFIIENSNTDRAYSYGLPGKSYVLAYRNEHGTIEFRQHGGCVDPNRIAHWVRFCTNFVDRSAQFVKKNRARIIDNCRYNFKKNDNPLRGLGSPSARKALQEMVI